jgi:hypothetical protein
VAPDVLSHRTIDHSEEVTAMRIKSSLLVLSVIFVSHPAFASIQLPLGIGNAGVGGLASSGYPAPFGFVDVAFVDATHATISLTNLGTSPTSPTVYFYGGQGTLGLNVNGTVDTTATLATITATRPFSAGAFSYGGAGNEDGFGSFNFTLDTFDGYTNSSSTINFTLIGSGTSWSSDTDVLTPNASGYLTAAHVFVSADGTKDGGAAITGYATNGDTSVGGGAPVPEPTALAVWSLFLGFAAIVASRRCGERCND